MPRYDPADVDEDAPRDEYEWRQGLHQMLRKWLIVWYFLMPFTITIPMHDAIVALEPFALGLLGALLVFWSYVGWLGHRLFRLFRQIDQIDRAKHREQIEQHIIDTEWRAHMQRLADSFAQLANRRATEDLVRLQSELEGPDSASEAARSGE